jgi:imidazolonepropionase-like amidohydrolase
MAIVEEAAARGTYVTAHVYTDEGVQRCLKAGVRSIEHGNFMTEETVARMAEKGAFLDPTFISLVQRLETAATSVNAELLMQKGELGTVAPGAYADLLVVEGDPLADIKVLVNPHQTLKLIMRGGVIYKNDLLH